MYIVVRKEHISGGITTYVMTNKVKVDKTCRWFEDNGFEQVSVPMKDGDIVKGCFYWAKVRPAKKDGVHAIFKIEPLTVDVELH